MLDTLIPLHRITVLTVTFLVLQSLDADGGHLRKPDPGPYQEPQGAHPLLRSGTPDLLRHVMISAISVPFNDASLTESAKLVAANTGIFVHFN